MNVVVIKDYPDLVLYGAKWPLRSCFYLKYINPGEPCGFRHNHNPPPYSEGSISMRNFHSQANTSQRNIYVKKI